MNNDLISRSSLKEAIIAMDYLSEINLNFICKVIDNAPTVEIPVARWDCYCEGQKVGYEKALSERPQGECDNCDYRKFTEQFINGVVDVMNKNGITSVEELQERLKGGTE